MKQLIFFITIFFLIIIPITTRADVAHIVISEIQAYGQTATDEFIRVYNPTAAAIDISGWRLAKKTSSGSESNLVSAFPDGTIIPPGSGFLIAHQTGYLGSETPGARYSGASYSIAGNNTVILKDASLAVIDKVGFGTAMDFEGAAAANPENGASIKRLNNNDTDNNKNDFSSPAPNITNEEIPLNPPLQKGEEAEVAEYGDIVINEIMPNPAEGKEWIELLNVSAKTFNLYGWKISDGSSVIYELEGQLATGGFFTAEVNNRLNNSGDAIFLSDASGKSIFQLTYGNWLNAKLPAPEKGQSLARNDDGKFYITGTPTKNAENLLSESITTVIDSADDFSTSTVAASPADFKYLSIIEILPDPEGSDAENEYIKIKNGSDADANLGGLYLDDAEGGSNPYKIPAGTIAKAGEEIIFYRSKTKIALNNTDDEARILSGSKEEIFSIDYEDAEEGAIYKFQNEKWGWDNIEAPVVEQSSLRGAAKNQESIETKKQNSTTINSITTIVITPPGIFSTQTMYVDGLQLYMYSKDWPELAVGDKIYAFGTPSTYYSEPRLKLKNKNSIKIISRGNTVEPAPADSLAEDDLGRLIIIEGEVLQIVGTKIIIDANGEEIPVYDKTKQKIFSHLKEKDEVRIAGIVTRYKDEFRLLPRSAEDVQIIKSSGADAPLENNNHLWQYAISTLAIGGISAGIYIRRRNNGKSDRSSQTLE